jgi:putative peptidoglycan lipid II flippase
VVQLSGYLDAFLATLLAAGAVSAQRYAVTLYMLPVSLFAMSVAAAELPELSRLDVRSARDEVRRRLVAGLDRIAFFVAPIQAIYLLAGGVVVGALLQRGEFGPDDTRLVWFVLAGSSLALLATTASRLLQSSLYALGDSRTPAVIAIVRVALSTLLGVGLMFQLDRVVIEPGTSELTVEGDLPAPLSPLPESVRGDDDLPRRLGAVGLTVASSVGAWLELALLKRALARRGLGGLPIGGPHRVPVVGAAVAAGVVALLLRWTVAADLSPIPAALVVLAPAGAVYLGITAALGVPEARALRRG